ncbi:lamin tail domain-containing protein [Spirosoma sp. BT702]|uniref:Lamin tail domain-containing protein n=1 Tax=Spirosoma profusum TaxID=2771354 RepID=A0A927AVA8_9BACT|nr:putative Ig domain-containing protein [Spirosoma profusum]MBD2705049.1 lamin tail domain-containing protein [Spirosoma profusum]
MKHVFLSRVFRACFSLSVVLLTASGSWGQSSPAPYSLSTGPYSFTGWAAASTAGTYPANMVFHFVGSAAPTTATPSSGDYNCAYNLTARSRINGKGDDGIGFIGTSDPRYDNCISGASSNTRYVGDAVLGLNTTGRQNIQVGWTGGTSTVGARTWGLQLQYRIGTSSSFTNVAGTSLYTSSAIVGAQIFAPVTLPASVENQTEVQLRWIYYEISGSGNRPEIRLDEITVTSQPLAVSQPDLNVSLTGPASATAGQLFTYSLVVGNSGTGSAANVPVSFTLPAGVTFIGTTETNGFTASQAGGVVSFTGGSLSSGSSATLTVSVSAAAAGTITAQPGAAVVDPANAIAERNEANNSSTTMFTTTIAATNQPPTAPTFTDQTGIVDVPFSYTVPAFTDPESQTITYAITGEPAGLSADNVSRVISGTPTATGSSAITVVATDEAGASTTATFGITINASQPPIATTNSNQTATVGVGFSYTVNAFTDPDNDALTYSASISPANGLTFDPVSRVISGTPTASGVSSVTITATDPASNTATTTFSLSVNPAPAGVIRITEYMYNGTPGEYVELTNVGNAPIDLTGWSYSDVARTPGSFSLSGFGVVQPNESVVFTEANASTFRTAWYLPASVKVLGSNTQNLGRSDEINIYDAAGISVDQLTFNDQAIPGSVRTADVSGWTAPANLGNNQAATYQLAVVGDSQNSYSATTGNVGNPGGYYTPLNRVLVIESGRSTTVAEGGATDSYTVKLNSQPTADVVVTVTSGSQLSASPVSLTFTPTSYSVAQTVTVSALDDNVVEGTHTAVITQATTSSDPAYNGIATNSVSVTITDNDNPVTAAPAIQVANTTTPYLSLSVSGSGLVSGVINDPTDPFTTLGVNFTLTDADTPAANLTVTATSSNTSVASSLTLTGSGSTRNLKIAPAGVGYSVITITVSDGVNTSSYVINYAASAASATPASTRFHTGVSDASTAISIDANTMLVADDENQVLRLYNRQNSGLPIAGFDFTTSLALTDISGGVPREVDIEGATRLNNRIFWMGSLSNADGGNNRPNRNRIFATDVAGTGAGTTLSYVGRYDYLRNDIIAWDVNNIHGKGPNYYGLAASAADGVGSKQSIGFNAEGLELAPDNTTAYVAFRAPQVPPTGRANALVIPVTNFTTLATAANGGTQGSATFGAPIEFDLGGRGIREIRKNSTNEYIIIAGPAGEAGAAPNDFRLYTWTGNTADLPMLRLADLTSVNANGSFESVVEVPTPLTDASQIQLLVDNGDAVYYNDGTIAKELSQNNFKKFRSDIVTLGTAFNTAPTVASAISPQSATVGLAYNFTIASNTFTDAQTPNNLTLSVSGLPDGLSFTAPATISGTPSTTVGSPFSVTVVATDPGSLSVSTTFTLTVSPPPNTTPTVVASIGNQTATVGQAYSFNIPPGTFTDAQTPNNLTLSVSGLPAGLNFTGASTISGTPSTTVGSPFTVTVVATDPGGLSVSTTFPLFVRPVPNTAPTVVGSVGSRTAPVNQAFTMTISAGVFADAETPNTLTFSVSGLPAGLNFTAPSTISGTPSTTVGSPFTVTVVATDPGGLTAVTTFLITVSNTTSCVNMVTVKAGNWNDASVWSCGRVPLPTDVVTIVHAVSLPVSYQGQALRMIYGTGGQLLFGTGSRLRLGGN